MAKKKTAKKKSIEALTHSDDKRTNIPTAELEAVVSQEDRSPIRVAIDRRDPDLDPQLVWRGKDLGDQMVVGAPPLYIQEKIHPKVLVDDLKRRTGVDDEADDPQLRLFSDFNGLPDEARSTEFYQHEANWTNRMILGDSLQVMASLAEREGLRGKVQCIYFDPPYGIKFNSNFQWSTTSRDVKDGKSDHITREPEQVKAFRDTWRDGIHSYLTYIRDRLLTAKDLLSPSGSMFVQIGDENIHRVRGLLDEVFGEENFVCLISYAKTTGFSGRFLSSVSDYILWAAKDINSLKYRPLYTEKKAGDPGASKYREARTISALSNSSFDLSRMAVSDQLTSQGASLNSEQRFQFQGKEWNPPKGLHWKTTVEGLHNLDKAGRVMQEGRSIRYARFLDDFAINPRSNIWMDIGGVQSRSDPKVYVVQTASEAIKRCVLMTTDPGDLVLDPTCGSGTAAYSSEQWGRRWITIDTSRVSLALARARIMGAKYPYYLLSDSREGKEKEAAVSRSPVSDAKSFENVRHGFVYERLPHVMLSTIANNAEIDVIWEQFQPKLEPLRESLNKELKRKAGKEDNEPFEEWTIPREADESWSSKAKKLHAEWWELRTERQNEIDASIAAKADFEYLYDKPYEDKTKVRVAGPFTVESLSPHRTLAVDHDDELIDPQAQAKVAEKKLGYGHGVEDFVSVILENLKTAGVQQAHKEDKIEFTSLTPWPGELVCAEGSMSRAKKEPSRLKCEPRSSLARNLEPSDELT